MNPNEASAGGSRGERSSQLKKGALELCVLALLSLRDMYGYELASTISRDIEISEGTIYPLLKRIRDDGLVTAYLKESQEGPPRKYYSITASGLTNKRELEMEWHRFTEGMSRILMLRGPYGGQFTEGVNV